MPEAPVRLTESAGVASACSLPFRLSAAATIVVGSPRAPATTTAVWPSGEIEAPGCGGTTDAIRRSARRTFSTFARSAWNAGSLTESVGECTTTIGAELERPAKFRWIRVRAATDSEPFACHPAPESAVSTCGANTASRTATPAQVSATARRWSAAQPPSRPTGPTTPRPFRRGRGYRRYGRFQNCHSVTPLRGLHLRTRRWYTTLQLNCCERG